MPNDPQFAANVVALLATYALHSSLLLGAVWLAAALGRLTSAPLLEWLWKLAALVPLVTAPLQFAGAERIGNWSIWTLPAVSFNSQAEPNAPAAPIPAGGFTNFNSERSAVRPEEESAGVKDGDGAAAIEIVPGRSESDADLPLPTIEPGPVVKIEVMQPAADDPIEAAEISPAIATRIEPTFPVESQSAGVASLSDDSGAKPVEGLSALAEPVSAWRGVVAAAFAALVVVGLARIGWRSLVARHRLRRTETINDGALRTSLDQLLARRNVKQSVRLAYSATANEPAAGGIWRWVIVVPPGIEEQLSPAEQQALLAHELAHLVRRDPLWLWIGTALCCCLPIQPLNFLAVRRWRQAAEELCDDWAIAGGVRPLTLANCLTRVAEWRLSPMPVGLTAGVGKSRFARRIGRLINGVSHEDRWSTPAHRRLLISGALCCIALLTCCGPRMQAAHRDDSSNAAIAATTPETPLTSGPAQSIADAADFTPSPIEAAQPTGDSTTSELRNELTALLDDLDRIETLTAEFGSDPEIEEVRARLRERLAALRTRLASEADP
ncbi:MAG: M56 family metallopeptidase [Planctomycetaceae bacterium]|nr:M56 family metallopeptidase [Planctomycetaceae bacterium]